MLLRSQSISYFNIKRTIGLRVTIAVLVTLKPDSTLNKQTFAKTKFALIYVAYDTGVTCAQYIHHSAAVFLKTVVIKRNYILNSFLFSFLF